MQKATQPAPALPSCNFDPSVKSQSARWFLVLCYCKKGNTRSFLSTGKLSSSGRLRGRLQGASTNGLLGVTVAGRRRERKSKCVRFRVLVSFLRVRKGCVWSSWDIRIANRLEIASRRIFIGEMPAAWCSNAVGVVLYAGKIAPRAIFCIRSNFFAKALVCWRAFGRGYHASALKVRIGSTHAFAAC